MLKYIYCMDKVKKYGWIGQGTYKLFKIVFERLDCLEDIIIPSLILNVFRVRHLLCFMKEPSHLSAYQSEGSYPSEEMA
jgi:hypothetical protein